MLARFFHWKPKNKLEKSSEQDLSNKEEILEKMAQLEHEAMRMRHQNKMLLKEGMDAQERERSLREQNQVINAELSLLRNKMETKTAYTEQLTEEVEALYKNENILKEKTQSLTEELGQKNEKIKHLKTYTEYLQDQEEEAQTVIQSKDELITEQSREILDQKELRNNLRQSDQDQMNQTSTDASTGTSQTRSWWQLCTKCMFKVAEYVLVTCISSILTAQVLSLLPDYCHGNGESVF